MTATLFFVEFHIADFHNALYLTQPKQLPNTYGGLLVPVAGCNVGTVLHITQSWKNVFCGLQYVIFSMFGHMTVGIVEFGKVEADEKTRHLQ
jgi:hypothetical protein